MSRIKEYFLNNDSATISAEIDAYQDPFDPAYQDAETKAFLAETAAAEEDLFLENFDQNMLDMAEQFETFNFENDEDGFDKRNPFQDMAGGNCEGRTYLEMSRGW